MVAITSPHDKRTMLPSAKATRHSDAASQAGTSTSSDKNALRVFSLIWEALDARMYREQLRTSSSSPGAIQLNDNITATFSSGSYFVDEVEIPLNPL